MKIILFFLSLILPFLFSQLASGKNYSLQKLTGEGLVQIQIKTSLESENQDVIKSFSSIQVQRKTFPLKNSSWKALLKKTKLKIVVIGDTGCRLKESAKGDEFQDCTDPKAWPFALIVQSVLKEKPDLILHVGDYHYREQCGKGKACEKFSPVVGYGWKPWELDFFAPAKPSFEAVPWLLVRGNHEACDRAFAGYGKLLATTAFSEPCVAYEEPDYIELKDLLIINLDTSSIPEGIETNEATNKIWLDRFKAIEAQVIARKAKAVWLVTHKPFYGLVKMGAQAAPVNVNLKKYLESTQLKSKIDLLLAGHIHLSQVIKSQNGPLQFVLGNGGTKLDLFSEFLQKTSPQALGLESIQTENPGFGYALFERESKGTHWLISFKDEQGASKSKCLFEPEKQSCLPQK